MNPLQKVSEICAGFVIVLPKQPLVRSTPVETSFRPPRAPSLSQFPAPPHSEPIIHNSSSQCWLMPQRPPVYVSVTRALSPRLNMQHHFVPRVNQQETRVQLDSCLLCKQLVQLWDCIPPFRKMLFDSLKLVKSISRAFPFTVLLNFLLASSQEGERKMMRCKQQEWGETLTIQHQRKLKLLQESGQPMSPSQDGATVPSGSLNPVPQKPTLPGAVGQMGKIRCRVKHKMPQAYTSQMLKPMTRSS